MYTSISYMTRLRYAARRLQEDIFERYCELTLNNPRKIIAITLACSILLTSFGFYFYFNVFNFNPTMGFETRGTILSDGRLLLENLKNISARPVDIYESLKKERPKRENNVVSTNITIIGKQSLSQENQLQSSSSTLEPINVDYNDYGSDSEPDEKDLADACVQYSSMGKKIPYQYMDYFAKIILEVENPDQLFTLPIFRHLCEVDMILKSTINSTNFPNSSVIFQNSFNLPLVATCLNFSTPNFCEALNEPDILNLKNSIEKCQQDPSDDLCQLEAMLQVRHYLLPLKNDFRYIAVVLPIIVSSSSEPHKFYNQLLTNLKKHFSKNIVLRGAFFNLKESQFSFAIKHDVVLATISAFFVFSCFLLYSRSIFFTIMILAIIILSMGISFTIYVTIFSIDFFPFLNLLVLVLMIAIGADDAFLLLNYFRQEVHIHSSPWKPGDIYLPPQSRHQRCLRLSLSHSLMSMFITSATTAVAFLSNFTSDILVLRCFGVYACLTVLVNYALVLLLLPSTLVLTTESEFDIKPKFKKSFKEIFIDFMVKFIFKFKYIICSLIVLLLIGSSVIVFYRPGLRVPKYNPTKVLTSSDPYEWYDDNSHLFDFQWKRSAHLMEYYVISDISISNSKTLSPPKKGKLHAPVLHVTTERLANIEETVNMLMSLNGIHNYTSWLSKFRARSRCSSFASKAVIPSSCFVSFSVEKLPSQFPDDLAVLPSDGPILDKKLNLIGYFIAIPTKTVLTSNADHIEDLFYNLDNHCKKVETLINNYYSFKCLSSADISKYYDILQQIRPSTIESVIISVFVSLIVVILCTRRLLLSIIAIIIITTIIITTVSILVVLGWQLSVVESTILILTIGLSMDFTLHMVAGLRSSGHLTDNLRDTLMSAGSACILAAITSVLCGLPLLFSSTAAFLEVGTMLITLGITSLIGSCVVLPAVLAIFQGKTVEITHF